MKALSAALSLLTSEVHPNMKVRVVKLTLQIMFNKEGSEYQFNTNKIKLCEAPYAHKDNKHGKQREIFNHFLHEFRHWMQSRIYKIGTSKIKYTETDIEHNTNAYYRSELEVDARQFVRQYLNKFIKYYNGFIQI